MDNIKICVYAICKNESKFIKKWLNSVKEADYICVLDTGSTDNSVELLKEANVILCEKKFTNFRFDEARNESLKLIPDDTDVCISIDLDEVLLPGWKEAIKKVWQKDTTRLRYIYNWSLDEFDNPRVSFYQDKIHSLKGYKWVNPVHEILSYQNGEEHFVTTDELIINHYPDATKSRGSYLSLLELSIKEDPENDRNTHYLGREYMYYRKWDKAIETLKKHLTLKRAVWKDERCASMRFIGRCYKHLNRSLEAEMWYKKAIDEAPHLKEPYSELALFYYDQGEYTKAIPLLLNTLKIKKGYKSYITEWFSTDFSVYDFLSICYYNTGDYDKALECVNKALEIKEDERVLNNKKLILEKV